MSSQSGILYDAADIDSVLDITMDDQFEPQHSVIVYFRVTGEPTAAIATFGELLKTTLSTSGTGVYEGHEVGLLDGDDAYLFMSGPDADLLFDTVRPVLDASPLTRGAEVTLRYGGPDDVTVPSRRLTVGEAGARRETCASSSH